jgi:hypothetical protein
MKPTTNRNKAVPRGLLLASKLEVITSKLLRSPPWLGWPLWNICVTNDHGYVPLVINNSRSFPHSRFITGFVTRLTRRVSLVEQELLTLPEHLSSPSVFSRIRVSRSLVLYVCFVDRRLFFWPLCCLFFDIRILITPLVSPTTSPVIHVASVVLLLLQTRWYVKNEERTGLRLRQTEDIVVVCDTDIP